MTSLNITQREEEDKFDKQQTREEEKYHITKRRKGKRGRFKEKGWKDGIMAESWPGTA